MSTLGERSDAVSCREIGIDDLDALARLLHRGFDNQPLTFWTRGLSRMADRNSPAGYPRFGFMLVNKGMPVGCHLTIYSQTAESISCNLGSHYVDPQHRLYATLLNVKAMRDRAMTYIDVTPAPVHFPLLEAHGFKRFCQGALLAATWLCRPERGAHVEPFDPVAANTSGLTVHERQLLSDHAGWGCRCLVVRDANGAHPFVFRHRRIIKGGMVPVAQLIYCRDIDDFHRLAGTLGRYLFKKGAPFVLADADARPPRLPGTFLNLPKFYKGPRKPRLGDLSNTELSIFGA